MKTENIYKEYLFLRNVRYWVFDEVFKSYLVLTESKSVDLDDVRFILEEHFESVDEATINETIEAIKSKVQLSKTVLMLIEKLLERGQYKKILAVLSCELFAKTRYMLFQGQSGLVVVKDYRDLQTEVNTYAHK